MAKRPTVVPVRASAAASAGAAGGVLICSAMDEVPDEFRNSNLSRAGKPKGNVEFGTGQVRKRREVGVGSEYLVANRTLQAPNLPLMHTLFKLYRTRSEARLIFPMPAFLLDSVPRFLHP